MYGRFSVEHPVVESGCDAWELDFVIKDHERYLERFEKDALANKHTGYYVAVEQLSELYERKADYKKAIEARNKRIEFMEKLDLLKFDVWKRNKANEEFKIKRLENLLLQKQ